MMFFVEIEIAIGIDIVAFLFDPDSDPDSDPDFDYFKATLYSSGYQQDNHDHKD